MKGFLESATNARGAPRSTGCLVLARTDRRSVASTRGNSFAFYSNQNSLLQGTVSVFSRMIWKEVCTLTSSCVRASYKYLHYDIWLEFMLYDLKWPTVVFLFVGFEVLFCILSCWEIEPRVVLFRHVTTEPHTPPPCLESRGPTN